MARRRRGQDEKPDLGFEIPEFDEDEFIRKETISFRTTLILFVYSVITAFVTFVLWATAVESWFVMLLIAGATGYLLRFIYPALKVDISHFGKKEWIGTGFLYFFSWLAFFIFLTNPPLYDGVEPDLDIHVTPDIQNAGSLVDVTLVAADNLNVDDDSITFTLTGPDGDTIASTADLRAHTNGHDIWTWNRTLDQTGQYTITASVSDTGGALFFGSAHTTTVERTFEISDEAFTVAFTGGGGETARFAAARDAVEVRIPTAVDVYRVTLEKDDGTSILLKRDSETSSENQHIYYAGPAFDGFEQGNNTFTVRVVEHDSYWLAKKYGIPGPDAPIVSTQEYTVIIDDASLLGSEEAKSPGQRRTTPEQTPGPGTPLVILGIIVAAALVARRRRD